MYISSDGLPSLEPRPSTQFFSQPWKKPLRKKLRGRPGFEAMVYPPERVGRSPGEQTRHLSTCLGSNCVTQMPTRSP